MIYDNMSRAYVRLPESSGGGRIPMVVTSDPFTKDVPKGNGRPGVYRNTMVSGFQVAPDGLTIYEVAEVNVTFMDPREEQIDVLDVDPETGEVMTHVPVIPQKTAYLYKRQMATQKARSANGGGTENVTVADAAEEVTA
jgi:hypothetical protein